MPLPSSHTTVRTVPYTAVPVTFCLVNLIACLLTEHPALPCGFRPLLPALGPLARHLVLKTENRFGLLMTSSALHRKRFLSDCRVGGGALACWPPSAAQTVRTVLPYTALMNALSLLVLKVSVQQGLSISVLT